MTIPATLTVNDAVDQLEQVGVREDDIRESAVRLSFYLNDDKGFDHECYYSLETLKWGADAFCPANKTRSISFDTLQELCDGLCEGE